MATVVAGGLVALQAPINSTLGKRWAPSPRPRCRSRSAWRCWWRSRSWPAAFGDVGEAADLRWYYLTGGVLGRGLRDHRAGLRAQAGRRRRDRGHDRRPARRVGGHRPRGHACGLAGDRRLTPAEAWRDRLLGASASFLIVRDSWPASLGRPRARFGSEAATRRRSDRGQRTASGELRRRDPQVVPEGPVHQRRRVIAHTTRFSSRGQTRGTIRCARSIQRNFHSCEALKAR